MHRTHFPKAVEPLYFARLIQKDFSLSEDLGPIFITADGTRYNGALSLLRRGGIDLEVLLELCVVLVLPPRQGGSESEGTKVRDSFLCRRRGSSQVVQLQAGSCLTLHETWSWGFLTEASAARLRHTYF